jgi:hypothetical protein
VGLAIFGVRLGQPCARLTHVWMKFSRVAQGHFLTAPSVCHGPNCPPLPRQAEQRMGWIVCGSDCHSQRLDPLLRGRTEQFGGGLTVRPLWGQIVTIYKCLWGKFFQCRMVRVRVSQCLNGVWPNHQGTEGCFVSKRFVPPYVWSRRTFGLLDVLSRGTFVLPEVLSLWMLCSTDIMSPAVMSSDVMSPDVLSL